MSSVANQSVGIGDLNLPFLNDISGMKNYLDTQKQTTTANAKLIDTQLAYNSAVTASDSKKKTIIIYVGIAIFVVIAVIVYFKFFKK
jgi:hypothetical protein